MLSRASLQHGSLKKYVYNTVRRNIGISAVLSQKASDPIQQLFVDKIREYDKKKKASGGKLVDANSETEKELLDELEKLKKQYGGDKEDLTQFPNLRFQDIELDDFNLEKKN